MDWRNHTQDELRRMVQKDTDGLALAAALDEADWPEMGRHVATPGELAELRTILRGWQERHGLCPSCARDIYTQGVVLFTPEEDTLCLRQEW